MDVWKILIILVILICVLCFDYILHIRKIYKIDGEELDNKILKIVRKQRKRRETIECIRRDVCYGSIRYARRIIQCMGEYNNFLMVTVVYVALNCRIYKYTIRIKKLELEQRRAKN